MHTLMLIGEYPLEFEEAKKYDVSTGYVALRNKEEDFCTFCRCLMTEEGSDLKVDIHVLYDCAAEEIADKQGCRVIIISNRVPDFKHTDKVVESYGRAIKSLEKKGFKDFGG